MFSERDIRQRDIVPPERLAECRATVVGVGAIGRQVAVQLTALGVQRLVLIDPGHVSQHRALLEGHAAEDVGRPKVHAAAQAAHQLNPLLDVETVVGRRPRRKARPVSGQ